MKALSCQSREVSLFSSFENIPKFADQNLYKRNFVVTGKGEKPLYCGKPHVTGLASDFSGASVTPTHCGKMACPSCSSLWSFQWIFKIACMVEAYSLYSGSRPAQGEASVDYNRTFTLKQIRNLSSRVNVKLKAQGVTAGVKLFHPFRFTAQAVEALKVLTRSEDSSKFWKFIKKDENILRMNDYLGTDFKDYYGFVNLAPHWHFLFFPGDQKITGTKKFFIKKNSYNEKIPQGYLKKWTLDSALSVVKFLSYLLTHCGSLEEGHGAYIHPISPFLGEMNRKNIEDFVSSETADKIRLEVLGILNQGLDRRLVLDDLEGVKWEKINTDTDLDFIPLSKFRLYSLDSHEYVNDFIFSGRGSKYPQNVEYIEYLIDVYNSVASSSEIPQKWKKLFIYGFGEILPDFVNPMASYSPLRALFESGLNSPPDSFKFYSGGSDFVFNSVNVENKPKFISAGFVVPYASEEERRKAEAYRASLPAIDFEKLKRISH